MPGFGDVKQGISLSNEEGGSNTAKVKIEFLKLVSDNGKLAKFGGNSNSTILDIQLLAWDADFELHIPIKETIEFANGETNIFIKFRSAIDVQPPISIWRLPCLHQLSSHHQISNLHQLTNQCQMLSLHQLTNLGKMLSLHQLTSLH